MPWLFGKPAKEEEQGSFCDRTSHYHYENVSREEAMNAKAVSEEHSDLRDAPKFPEGTSGERFNLAIMETDLHGAENQAKYGPGF